MNEDIAIKRTITIKRETFEFTSFFRSINVISLTLYMKIESITLNKTRVTTLIK